MLTSIKRKINSNTETLGDFNTSLTPMARSSRQKISKKTQALNDTLDQINLLDTFIGHSVQKQQNILSFQVFTECPPKQTTFLVTIQASMNLRKLKLYQASFLNTIF